MHSIPISHSAAAKRPPALISLRGANAEWHVGAPPSCLASVRLLDHVDFTVRAGECVIVRHNDAAGVRVLVAALAGDALPRARFSVADRHIAAGLRVRRASIHADLVAPIASAWQATSVAHCATHPTVHLLRASRRCYPPNASSTLAIRYERNVRQAHDEWQRWANAQCRAGHAVVLLVDSADDAGMTSGAGSTPPLHLLREQPAAGTLNARNKGAIRSCLLHNGRLAPLSPHARAEPSPPPHP